jgi:catechol 2,3-dioxygenase-like lactoylglutathione lyase family enzyme
VNHDETTMITDEIRGNGATDDARVAIVDMKLEVVIIPVSDVDRAKAFYARLGWRIDADFAFANGFRVVQFTPPGSACSVQFGAGITLAARGSSHGNYLVVSDITVAHDNLVTHGVEASVVFHVTVSGAQFQPGVESGRVAGFAPDRESYGSYETTFRSASDLASAMRRASMAHGEHEKRIGAADANWPAWYAAYMQAEQAGTALPV